MSTENTIENENNLNEQIKQDTENISEEIVERPNEIIKLDTQTANTSNCLALTIQKDHKLVAIKNIAFRSIRMSWKVIVSSISLGIMRLFS